MEILGISNLYTYEVFDLLSADVMANKLLKLYKPAIPGKDTFCKVNTAMFKPYVW